MKPFNPTTFSKHAKTIYSNCDVDILYSTIFGLSGSSKTDNSFTVMQMNYDLTNEKGEEIEDEELQEEMMEKQIEIITNEVEQIKQINSEYILQFERVRKQHFKQYVARLGYRHWFVFQPQEYQLLNHYIGNNYIFTYKQTQFFIHDIIKALIAFPSIYPIPQQFILGKNETPISCIKMIPFPILKFSTIQTAFNENEIDSIDFAKYYPPEILNKTIRLERSQTATKQYCYTIGCILYELVTGKQYRTMEQLNTIIECKEINTYSEEENQKINEVLMKCLENDVEKRCTFEELLEMTFITEAIEYKENIISIRDNQREYTEDLFKEKVALGSKGAFASVYKAKMMYNGVERTVAIKEIESTEKGYELKKQFLVKEAIIMKSCQHRNLVDFIDFFKMYITKENGEIVEKYCLIMDYCECGDLMNYMVKQIEMRKEISQLPFTVPKENENDKDKNENENKQMTMFKLTEIEIKHFLKDIANGLNYFHFVHRLVHRDLKPQNFLLTKVNGEFVLKITDYGFSKIPNSNLNHTNLGTMSYKAPEMFTSNGYTDNIDLYALGVILYMMTFGYFPKTETGEYIDFESKSIEYHKIDIPQDDSIDPDLYDLIVKLLILDPDHRMTWEQFYNHEYIENLGLQDLVRPTEKEFNLFKSSTFENEEIIDIDESF